MNDMTLNWYKSIKNRTSVREFSDTVDQKTFTELKKFAAGLNNDEARLVLRSKDGVLKSIFLAYGRVAGTKGFAAVITKKGSKYMGGYIGEAFVLECTAAELQHAGSARHIKSQRFVNLWTLRKMKRLPALSHLAFMTEKLNAQRRKASNSLQD